jgi:hypothetical protein
VSNAIELASTESISEGDIAIRRYQSRVIELPDDLEAVIDAVRERKELKGRQGAHFYIVSQVQIYEHPGSEISDYCAKLLELCNGRRTVAQITERLADHIYVTPQTARDRVYLMLLENMRSEGLISMYRIASLAAANQPHFQLVEYSDINAEASRQNQRSIHVE